MVTTDFHPVDCPALALDQMVVQGMVGVGQTETLLEAVL